MRPLRLVHVTTVGQSLRFLTGQLRFMQQQGFEVTAVSSPDDHLQTFCKSEGIHFHPVVMLRAITPLKDLVSLRSLVNYFRHLKPDIVHAHTPKGGLLGMLAARLAHVPVRIYHIHGLPLVTARGLRRVLFKNTERIAIRNATRVLCVSQSVAVVAVSEHLCGDNGIGVLGHGSINGVESAMRFNPRTLSQTTRADVRCRVSIPEEAPVIGFVGRLVRDKGIVELAEAWHLLRNRFPALHLLIVGEFECRDSVPAAVRESLLGDTRVHWVGADWNTPPLYAAMDVVVLPTYREGFPTVPLEAAAMELPVVATRVPGCVDAVVDGVTGVLVPPGDACSLAAALAAYIESAPLRASHGRAARERVKEYFQPSTMWALVLREYQHQLVRAGYSLELHAPDSSKHPANSSLFAA